MHSTDFVPTSDDVEYSYEAITKLDHFTFHHNGDYSGNVIIQHTTRKDIHSRDYDRTEIMVPYWMLKEFVGRQVQSDIISDLEAQSGRETLVAIQRMLI